MNLLFGSVTALFLAMSLSALFHLRWARRLPPIADLPATPDEKPLRCSIVFAARNEKDRVESTIRHLLAQTGVAIEIIAVDDRSSDGTGAILARLAAED